MNGISLGLPNGSRIVGLPANEATVRGFTAPGMVVIDEARACAGRAVSGDAADADVRRRRLWLMTHAVGQARVLLRNVGERGSGVDAGGGAGDGVLRGCVRRRWRRSGPRWATRGSARSILCEFVQADDSVFREEDVYACLRDDVPALFLEGV